MQILKKLTLGLYGCNCYLVGSKVTNEVFIIDPGAESKVIIENISKLNVNPKAIILTHAHNDHTGSLRAIKHHYQIPLWYNKDEYKNPIFIKADKWLSEGDILELGNVSLSVLETRGYSLGSISLFSKDIKFFNGIKYDGIIFTGDTIFRRSKGITQSNEEESLLFSNIKNKIVYNSE